MFKLQHVFDFMKLGCPSKIEMPSQILVDINLVEKYLKNLDELTSSGYIDNILKKVQPEVDDYLRVLNLDYPQFNLDDEIMRLKDNAKYLRGAFLYPAKPFEAYLTADNEKNSLVLVNTNPVPFKIIGLIDITTNQKFIINNNNSDYILKNHIPNTPANPTKFLLDTLLKIVLLQKKIKNMRIIAKF